MILLVAVQLAALFMWWVFPVVPWWIVWSPLEVVLSWLITIFSIAIIVALVEESRKS